MKRILALVALFASNVFANPFPEEVVLTIYARRDGDYVNANIRESKPGAINDLITKLGQGEEVRQGTPSGDVIIDCRRTMQSGRSMCSFGFSRSANVIMGGTSSRWAVDAHLDPSEMGSIRSLEQVDIDFINHAFDEFKLRIDETGLTAEVLNN